MAPPSPRQAQHSGNDRSQEVHKSAGRGTCDQEPPSHRKGHKGISSRFECSDPWCVSFETQANSHLHRTCSAGQRATSGLLGSELGIPRSFSPFLQCLSGLCFQTGPPCVKGRFTCSLGFRGMIPEKAQRKCGHRTGGAGHGGCESRAAKPG